MTGREAASRAARLPWLLAARSVIAESAEAGRLPHALLLVGIPGIGKRDLAEWIARYALCAGPTTEACGVCDSCRLYAADTHPDLVRLGVPEDKKQIPIEMVRDLTAALALKSYRGARRVAILDPADALSRGGANALLKTLEEPGGGALLILTVTRPDRLPSTIASRCQRIALRAPATGDALAWLEAERPGGEWGPALKLAAGAPLAALGFAGFGDFEREMGALPGMLARPDADVVAIAEKFQKSRPAERLRWIEQWLAERIQKGLLAPTEGTDSGVLERRRLHVQALFALLDQARQAQALLPAGTVNVQALFEQFLIGIGRELAALRPGR
jgi:DNA polymerase-3 subunit delta'